MGAPAGAADAAARSAWLHDKKRFFQSTTAKRPPPTRAGKKRAAEAEPVAVDLGTLTRLVDEQVAAVTREQAARADRVRRQLLMWQQELARLGARHQQRERNEAAAHIAALERELAAIPQALPAAEVRRRAAPFLAAVQEVPPTELSAPLAATAPGAGGLAPAKGAAAPRDAARAPGLVQMTLGAQGLQGPLPAPAGAASAPSARALAPARAWQETLFREFQAEVQGARQVVVVKHDVCPACERPLILTESGSLLMCEICRTIKPHLDATMSNLGYKEDVDITDSDYKRISHFNDWLTKAQAKETTRVEDSIVEQITQSLARRGDPRAASKEAVNRVVRELHLQKCYDHVTQIWVRITGNEPPQFTPEQVETFRSLFHQIQAPWEAHRNRFCRTQRINFLSYPYCIHKFCQLKGYTKYLKDFQLPKGGDKLKYHELVFEAICADLQWQFIPSNPSRSQQFAAQTRKAARARPRVDARRLPT